MTLRLTPKIQSLALADQSSYNSSLSLQFTQGWNLLDSCIASIYPILQCVVSERIPFFISINSYTLLLWNVTQLRLNLISSLICSKERAKESYSSAIIQIRTWKFSVCYVCWHHPDNLQLEVMFCTTLLTSEEFHKAKTGAFCLPWVENFRTLHKQQLQHCLATKIVWRESLRLLQVK